MKILFLDDDPNRHRRFCECTIGVEKAMVETPGQAFEELRKHADDQFDVVCLDHDLEGKIYQPSDEKSGYAVAQFLNEMLTDHMPKRVVIHSYNQEGVRNMVRALDDSQGYMDIVVAPFDSDTFWESLRLRRSQVVC